MAERGKFSPRGRGRGRGSFTDSPSSGPPKILPNEGKEPPPLYPPISLPPRPKLNSRDEYLLRKNAHIKRRLYTSPYHLTLETEEKIEIKRYSDKYLPKKEKPDILDYVQVEAGIFPDELLFGRKRTNPLYNHLTPTAEVSITTKATKTRKATKEKQTPKKKLKESASESFSSPLPPPPLPVPLNDNSLDLLLTLERREATQPKKKEEEGEEVEDAMDAEEEEEDEEDDYSMNYWAKEDEEDWGDDGGNDDGTLVHSTHFVEGIM